MNAQIRLRVERTIVAAVVEIDAHNNFFIARFPQHGAKTLSLPAPSEWV